MAIAETSRVRLAKRGRTLAWVTIAYNSLEGVAAIASGLMAGSISLLGFGIDSLIEVTSGGAAMWRLTADIDFSRRESAERQALRIIGILFIALALYVGLDAVKTLWYRERPEESYFGIAIAIGSIVVMPLLARAKRRVAHGLSSRALHADAKQTDLCAYLSGILLGGLVLNVLLGWWWADPVAALVMAPIIAREGIEALRERSCSDCHVDVSKE